MGGEVQRPHRRREPYRGKGENLKGQTQATVSALLMVAVVSFAGGMIFQDYLISSAFVKHEVVPAMENPDPLPYTLPLKYAQDILWWSEKTRLPISILCRMFSKESSPSGRPTDGDWNPDAVSYMGAIGIAQIMPENLSNPLFLAFNDGLPIDPRNPSMAIKVGTRYLAYLYNMKGDIRLAIGAYNAGPYRKPNWWKAETVNYVRAILP